MNYLKESKKAEKKLNFPIMYKSNQTQQTKDALTNMINSKVKKVDSDTSNTKNNVDEDGYF